MPIEKSKNKDHPIIFIHAGTAHYNSSPEHLEYVLRQAKKSNPDSTVYLIGDNGNNKYDFIEHCDIKNYFGNSDIQNFKKIYKHFSRSPYESDLFVFQKWLVLRDFVIEKKIDKFLLVDTDLMIFCDIKKEFDKFKNYDFTISFEQSPHCIFFNNQESLIDFCKFFMDIYAGKNDEDYSKIKKHYDDLKISNKLGGNVCDMTFFKLYNLKSCKKIFYTTEIVNGSTYDNNINCSFDNKHGYKMRFWVKKIFWINRLPYCELIEGGKKIKFNTLHFPGSNKKYIKRIYYHKQAVPINEAVMNFCERIKNKIKKILTNNYAY